MMSGLTAGSGTMGTATSALRDSGLGGYNSQVRSSQKGSHSMRPAPMRGIGAYDSAATGNRPRFDQVPD